MLSHKNKGIAPRKWWRVISQALELFACIATGTIFSTFLRLTMVCLMFQRIQFSMFFAIKVLGMHQKIVRSIKSCWPRRSCWVPTTARTKIASIDGLKLVRNFLFAMSIIDSLKLLWSFWRPWFRFKKQWNKFGTIGIVPQRAACPRAEVWNVSSRGGASWTGSRIARITNASVLPCLHLLSNQWVWRVWPTIAKAAACKIGVIPIRAVQSISTGSQPVNKKRMGHLQKVTPSWVTAKMKRIFQASIQI